MLSQFRTCVFFSLQYDLVTRDLKSTRGEEEEEEEEEE